MTTLIPVVTPQQQMALAFRDFSLPEGTEVKVDTARGPQTRVKVWAIGPRGIWVEAIGRDAIDAVHNLVREVSRP